MRTDETHHRGSNALLQQDDHHRTASASQDAGDNIRFDGSLSQILEDFEAAIRRRPDCPGGDCSRCPACPRL